MSVSQLKNKQGFTIIEVVLVLAIAALIFLMVFIALPALQRNQRDTARKTVMGKVASAVTSYQSNNRGANPTAANFVDNLKDYVDGKDGTLPAGAPVPINGISMENDTYFLTVTAPSPSAPVKAFKYDGYARVGEDNPTTKSSTQIIQIVPGAKCDANGTQAIFGNKREAAVLIGLENGNAGLCQNV